MSDPAPRLDLLEIRNGCGIRDTASEKLSFGENIEKQRIALGLTQSQAAKLVPVSPRTWEYWATGEVTPRMATQAAVFRVLDGAMPEPSPRRRAKMRRAHHLFWDRHKGWFTRVTITMDKKMVGKRMKFRLYTKDEKEAIRARVVLLSGFRKLGLTVVSRLQKPTKRAGGAGPNGCQRGGVEG